MTETDIRTLVRTVGGLATQADLAREWNLSRPRVCQLVRLPEFPPPVTHVSGGKSAVWAKNEVNDWRALRKGMTHAEGSHAGRGAPR